MHCVHACKLIYSQSPPLVGFSKVDDKISRRPGVTGVEAGRTFVDINRSSLISFPNNKIRRNSANSLLCSINFASGGYVSAPGVRIRLEALISSPTMTA